MRITQDKKPAAYRGRVNWYVAYYRPGAFGCCGHGPTYLFNTQREARDFATRNELGAEAHVDWFPPDDTSMLRSGAIDYR